MLTSVSAGIHRRPFGSPLFKYFGSATPGAIPVVSIVDQQVSPALPASFPTHLTSGPISENITAFGCRLLTISQYPLKSYTIAFALAPFAPSNHTSATSP